MRLFPILYFMVGILVEVSLWSSQHYYGYYYFCAVLPLVFFLVVFSFTCFEPPSMLIRVTTIITIIWIVTIACSGGADRHGCLLRRCRMIW